MSAVAIIGGGIIGLCSAYYLKRDGHTVTVIDQTDMTDGCSYGNMGYMSPSHFIPLASPGIIQEGLRHMLSSTSPFYIKPRMNMELMQWMFRFYKSCNAATVKRNAPHLNNILQLSRSLINDMRTAIGDDFDMEEKGCLMMCKQAATLRHEFELADDAERLGLQIERLEAAAVQALEPSVELAVAGAVLYKDDCHFNPGKFMKALRSFLESEGVIFRLSHTVIGFEKHDQEVDAVLTDKEKFDCDKLVVATGSWLPVQGRMLGIKLLLQPGKGYSYTYDDVQPNINYPAILVDGRCAITPWKNSLRIGGTMEISGMNSRMLFRRMGGIYDSVTAFYPGLDISFPPKEKVWSGLRPVTPDGLPYIGSIDTYENVVFAGGHAMLGISQGPGTGLLVSQMINGHTTEIPIDAFRLNRFD